MSFFDIFFKQPKFDTLIRNYLDEGKIIEHRLAFIESVGHFKFYKSKTINRLKIIEDTKKLKDESLFIGYNIIIKFEKSLTICIVFNWKGLKELISILEKSKNDETYQRKLFIAKYDIEKYLEGLSVRYDEILTYYNSKIVIKNDMLILYDSIIPNKCTYQNKVFEIPIRERIEITKLDIYIDLSCSISAVNINARHPNADKKGWFCLGSLKMIPCTVQNIENIISQIKIYKLDDSYWKPKNYYNWEV